MNIPRTARHRPTLVRPTHRTWLMPTQMGLFAIALVGVVVFLFTGTLNAIPLIGLFALAAFVLISGVFAR